MTLREVEALLAKLAALHAGFWQSPRLGGDLDWLPTPRRGGMYEVFTATGLKSVRAQVEGHELKAELIRPLRRSVDQLWENLWKVQSRMSAEPTTLLHGDAHIGNTYLLPHGRGGVLDWQLMMRGSWAHDVTYLLVTGLEPDLRRRHQRDLLAGYLGELHRRGVPNAPGEQEPWTLYRQAVVWGPVIGWLITAPENYGPDVTAANISRALAAVQDLDSLAAIAQSAFLTTSRSEGVQIRALA